MVSKITIFELHFDGAQFGPESIDVGPEDLPGTDDSSEADAGELPGTDDSSEADADSKSPLVMFLQGATVFVLMFVVLWVGLSRLLSDEDESE